MPISKFKATCLAALERVRRTRRPLRVTRFGRPIADIMPPTAVPEENTRSWFGSMADSAEIVGDLVAPLDVEWEVLTTKKKR
ncbi:MAG: type II toxin-antitoxin system prevent-host-death family antitoxin [Kofleriaceae bacterium]